MPLANYDQYFGGKKGAAAKAYAAMVEEYGEKDADRIFYAKINKLKRGTAAAEAVDPTDDGAIALLLDEDDDEVVPDDVEPDPASEPGDEPDDDEQPDDGDDEDDDALDDEDLDDEEADDAEEDDDVDEEPEEEVEGEPAPDPEKLAEAFNPDQPRQPAGVPSGGQWKSTGHRFVRNIVQPQRGAHAAYIEQLAGWLGYRPTKFQVQAAMAGDIPGFPNINGQVVLGSPSARSARVPSGVAGSGPDHFPGRRASAPPARVFPGLRVTPPPGEPGRRPRRETARQRRRWKIWDDLFAEASDDCKWITYRGNHICITGGHGGHQKGYPKGAGPFKMRGKGDLPKEDALEPGEKGDPPLADKAKFSGPAYAARLAMWDKQKQRGLARALGKPAPLGSVSSDEAEYQAKFGLEKNRDRIQGGFAAKAIIKLQAEYDRLIARDDRGGLTPGRRNDMRLELKRIRKQIAELKKEIEFKEAAEELDEAWNEDDHPRHPAGSDHGGEFAPKGGGDDGDDGDYDKREAVHILRRARSEIERMDWPPSGDPKEAIANAVRDAIGDDSNEAADGAIDMLGDEPPELNSREDALAWIDDVTGRLEIEIDDEIATRIADAESEDEADEGQAEYSARAVQRFGSYASPNPPLLDDPKIQNAANTYKAAYTAWAKAMRKATNDHNDPDVKKTAAVLDDAFLKLQKLITKANRAAKAKAKKKKGLGEAALENTDVNEEDDVLPDEDALQEYGTSEGARKGWETRRGHGSGGSGYPETVTRRERSTNINPRSPIKPLDQDYINRWAGTLGDMIHRGQTPELPSGEKFSRKHAIELGFKRWPPNEDDLRTFGGPFTPKATRRHERRVGRNIKLAKRAARRMSRDVFGNAPKPRHYPPMGSPVRWNREVTEEEREFALAESCDLIEARPAGPLRSGRLNRSLNVIEGTVLITANSVNGGKGGRRYSDNALKQIAERAEGLPAYLNHVAPDLAFKPRDVKDLIGVHRNVRYHPTEGRIISDLHIVEHQAPIVFGLAEKLGDHIGNSLVSRGLVQMEGETEVVKEVMTVRSADLVSDPATTKGLFEAHGYHGAEDDDPFTTLIEELREAITHPKEEAMDLAAIMTFLKDKPDQQGLVAEAFGFIPKPAAAQLSEQVAALKTERDAVVTELKEVKISLDGHKAKDALAEKRAKIITAIESHDLGKQFGKIKEAVTDRFKSLLEQSEEAEWPAILDDRFKSLKGVSASAGPTSGPKTIQETDDNNAPISSSVYDRLARALAG